MNYTAAAKARLEEIRRDHGLDIALIITEIVTGKAQWHSRSVWLSDIEEALEYILQARGPMLSREGTK